MPRKPSPRKTNPRATEAQPSKPEVKVITSVSETVRPNASVSETEAAGEVPVLVPAGAIANSRAKAAAASSGAAPGRVAKTVSVIPSASMEEAIRQRAFELYQQRGPSTGHEVEDWLRAEREVWAAREQRRRA